VEDDEIRAALRRGDDHGAFRLLLRTHGPVVYSACCRILRDATAAQDVVQQAMIAAFNNRRKLLAVDQIRGWLIRVATRKCLDAIRSSKRTDRLHRDVADGDTSDLSDVLDQLATTEERRALEECLATLPPDVAAAVLMRHRDGMSWAQIAEAVDMPLDTIRMRVQRGALKSLRDCLEAKEVAP